MLFRNPFKNGLSVVDMGVILACSVALTVMACHNTGQWFPLILLCPILGSLGGMFIASKALRVSYAVVLLALIVVVVCHDFCI